MRATRCHQNERALCRGLYPQASTKPERMKNSVTPVLPASNNTPHASPAVPPK